VPLCKYENFAPVLVLGNIVVGVLRNSFHPGLLKSFDEAAKDSLNDEE